MRKIAFFKKVNNVFRSYSKISTNFQVFKTLIVRKNVYSGLQGVDWSKGNKNITYNIQIQ